MQSEFQLLTFSIWVGRCGKFWQESANGPCGRGGGGGEGGCVFALGLRLISGFRV